MRITLNTQEIIQVLEQHLASTVGVNVDSSNSLLEVVDQNKCLFHIEVNLLSTKPVLPVITPTVVEPKAVETPVKEVPLTEVLEQVTTEPEQVVTEPEQVAPKRKSNLFSTIKK